MLFLHIRQRRWCKIPAVNAAGTCFVASITEMGLMDAKFYFKISKYRFNTLKSNINQFPNTD
jgi:hypothetical protein